MRFYLIGLTLLVMAFISAGPVFAQGGTQTVTLPVEGMV